MVKYRIEYWDLFKKTIWRKTPMKNNIPRGIQKSFYPDKKTMAFKQFKIDAIHGLYIYFNYE